MMRLHMNRTATGATALVLAILTSVASPGVAGASRSKVIHVNDDAEAGGDGSARSPYENLPDALAAARATSGDVVVSVAPGDYELTSTLVIDRPLDLRG